VFDKDMSGFVSSSELKFVMSNLGVNFTDEELLEMMIEVTFFTTTQSEVSTKIIFLRCGY
jgi:Ca2+-binding EF-hand superfamily protein